MQSVSARSSCRFFQLRVLLGLGAMFLAAGACHAATFSNTVAGAKFTERLSRTVKFVHAGPVVGDFALLNDRGTFTLQGTLSLAGIDQAFLTPVTQIGISLVSLENTEFSFFFSPAEDPDFDESGVDTSAKIVRTAEFAGRTQVVFTATAKINPLTETLRLKFTGRSFGAMAAPDTELERAGFTVAADSLLGQPSQEVAEPMVLSLFFDDGADMVVGSILLNVGGRVKTTARTDREIGTFNASVVGLVGLPTRTRDQ